MFTRPRIAHTRSSCMRMSDVCAAAVLHANRKQINVHIKTESELNSRAQHFLYWRVPCVFLEANEQAIE